MLIHHGAHLHTDVELALSKSDEHSGSFSPIIYFADVDDEKPSHCAAGVASCLW